LIVRDGLDMAIGSVHGTRCGMSESGSIEMKVSVTRQVLVSRDGALDAKKRDVDAESARKVSMPAFAHPFARAV
jgi:hypothetical protein